MPVILKCECGHHTVRPNHTNSIMRSKCARCGSAVLHRVEPYRTPSGRVAYERMSRDLATKLRIREAELATIPKPVRVICRVVCLFLRGKGAA